MDTLPQSLPLHTDPRVPPQRTKLRPPADRHHAGHAGSVHHLHMFVQFEIPTGVLSVIMVAIVIGCVAPVKKKPTRQCDVMRKHESEFSLSTSSCSLVVDLYPYDQAIEARFARLHNFVPVFCRAWTWLPPNIWEAMLTWLIP